VEVKRMKLTTITGKRMRALDSMLDEVIEAEEDKTNDEYFLLELQRSPKAT
jgi:hypothetical protein